MNKRKKGISLFVIILFLAGITTAFVKVHGVTEYNGTVTDSATTPNVISGAYVALTDSLFNVLGADHTDSNGEYSISTSATTNKPYTLSVGKTRFDTEYLVDNDGGDNDFSLEGDGEKLAYLFWAENAGDEDIIQDYENILEAVGYTVDPIMDCADVEDKCDDIRDYEIYSDTIFVYVIGHGSNTTGHSYTCFASQDGSNTSSQDFRGWMDEWEAERKCILVDSCYSGDWADDFAASPYLAMSSADETHVSYSNQSGGYNSQGIFSCNFFYAIDTWDYTAVQAYDYAEQFHDEATDTWPSYPKKQDYSSYTWFN